MQLTGWTNLDETKVEYVTDSNDLWESNWIELEKLQPISFPTISTPAATALDLAEFLTELAELDVCLTRPVNTSYTSC